MFDCVQEQIRVSPRLRVQAGQDQVVAVYLFERVNGSTWQEFADVADQRLDCLFRGVPSTHEAPGVGGSKVMEVPATGMQCLGQTVGQPREHSVGFDVKGQRNARDRRQFITKYSRVIVGMASVVQPRFVL